MRFFFLFKIFKFSFQNPFFLVVLNTFFLLELSGGIQKNGFVGENSETCFPPVLTMAIVVGLTVSQVFRLDLRFLSSYQVLLKDLMLFDVIKGIVTRCKQFQVEILLLIS